MSTVERVWHVVACITILIIGSWWIGQFELASDNQDYPSRPIHVVVPYAAGGGSDTFVRIVQQGIAEGDLLPQPLVIINQAGGIGTIGSREVKNAPPDGYKILCHHNAIITAKLAGTVTYGPEAFEPIAMTGEMSMVILVRADAPIRNVGGPARTGQGNTQACPIRSQQRGAGILHRCCNWSTPIRAPNSASYLRAVALTGTRRSWADIWKPGSFRFRSILIFERSREPRRIRTFEPSRS